MLALLARPDVLGAHDFVVVHELAQRYTIDALRHGRLPLWDPYVGLGRPFLADVEHQVFYPPALLVVLLGPGIGSALLATLHSVLAALGTALLARHLGARRAAALVAGLAYAFCGPVLGCYATGQLMYGIGLAWLPLVLLLAARVQERPSLGAVAVLASALGLQILSGHQQAVWITGLAAVVFVAMRRLERPLGPSLLALLGDELRLAAAAAWGLALAAVQLLPFAELFTSGNRSQPSLQFASSFAMTAAGWRSLGQAMTSGAPVPSIYYLYAGIPVLLAGAAGLIMIRQRNQRALLALASLATLIAAGTATPAFELAYRIVPGLAMFRVHSRMTVLLVLALILAGALWMSCESGSRTRRRELAALAVGGIPAALLAVLTARPALAVLVLACAVLLAVARAGAKHARHAAAALVLLLALDVGVSTVRLKRFSIRPIDTDGEELLAGALRGARLLGDDGQPPPRVSFPGLRANAGEVHGWSTFDHYGFVTARVWKYLHDTLGLDAPLRNRNQPSRRIFERGAFPYDDMSLVAGLGADGVPVFRPGTDARALVVTRALHVVGPDEALRAMRGVDLTTVALVESAALVREGPAGAAGSARFVRFAPERLELEVEASAAGLLVLKEAWFPGWTATVNGASVPCAPANVWMRAVPVPAGKSHVVLRYRSTYLTTGAAISLLAGTALLATFVAGRRRKRMRERDS